MRGGFPGATSWRVAHHHHHHHQGIQDSNQTAKGSMTDGDRIGFMYNTQNHHHHLRPGRRLLLPLSHRTRVSHLVARLRGCSCCAIPAQVHQGPCPPFSRFNSPATTARHRSPTAIFFISPSVPTPRPHHDACHQAAIARRASFDSLPRLVAATRSALLLSTCGSQRFSQPKLVVVVLASSSSFEKSVRFAAVTTTKDPSLFYI